MTSNLCHENPSTHPAAPIFVGEDDWPNQCSDEVETPRGNELTHYSRSSRSPLWGESIGWLGGQIPVNSLDREVVSIILSPLLTLRSSGSIFTVSLPLGQCGLSRSLHRDVLWSSIPRQHLGSLLPGFSLGTVGFEIRLYREGVLRA